jgi:radical SAM superfamily enzyme YgiQ (UPF0313 family)
MKEFLAKHTKCLLVQPKFSTLSFWNYEEVCKILGAKYPNPPLGLMTVAALLPQQWEFKLVDENVEPLLDEHLEWADITCTGGMLAQQLGLLSVIERARHSGCPVVVGGPDPTSQPHVYQSADYLVLGEGEVTIPMFIQDLERGCRSGEYRSTEKADMTKSVVPRFDLIRFRDYVSVGIQYSRGCPFNCEFCDIIELYGRKQRAKTPEHIVREFQSLHSLGFRGQIFLVDDNFVGNKREVKKFLRVIREWSEANRFPFFFTTQTCLDLADDDEILQMMRDVDFKFVFIGIESPEDTILISAQKPQNANKSIPEAIRKIYSHGMTVNAGFILGFDNESDRTAEEMIRCIQDSGISIAMVGLLSASPNTQLGRRLKREGRLFEKAAIQTDAHIGIDQMTGGLNFIPTRPRSDVLKDFVQVLEHVYDPRNYFIRVTYTGLTIIPADKYKPDIVERVKSLKPLLKVCYTLGCNKTTGWLYWKMLLAVLFKNPRGIEAAIIMATMYIHFQKQSKFIIDLTRKKIDDIERYGEEHYVASLLEPGSS